MLRLIGFLGRGRALRVRMGVGEGRVRPRLPPRGPDTAQEVASRAAGQLSGWIATDSHLAAALIASWRREGTASASRRCGELAPSVARVPPDLMRGPSADPAAAEARNCDLLAAGLSA